MRDIIGLCGTRVSKKHTRSSGLGFTLVELMMVITIILTLALIAGVRYKRSIAYTKEVALHNDLSAMRQAIGQYTLDNLKPPQSLDDLVSGGCLGQIPVDPVTGIKDWTTESSGALATDQGAGISDCTQAQINCRRLSIRRTARGKPRTDISSQGTF
jgi:general secretion pathway protein G